MIKTVKIILLSAFILTGYFSGYAQVTVGSTIDPVKAALLDLKSFSLPNDLATSSTGGLILPRVMLEDRATLEPFIGNDAEWQTNKKKLNLDHIGLMVYNLSDKNGFKPGIYIWTDGGWRQLDIAADYIYAPSFNLAWKDGTFDIYNDAYKANFKPDAGKRSNYFSNKGAGILLDLPDFETSPQAFYYVVTDYSENALKVNSISENGVISYEKKGSGATPPKDAYLNVIMIRK